MANESDIFASLFGGGSSKGGYADLNQFQNTLAANDLWRKAAAPVLGAKFDMSTWSPGQQVGVSAGQAFLGAILNAIGQRSESNQLAKVAQVLPQLYDNPTSVAIPNGVDPEAFGGLKISAIKENALISNRNDEAKQKLFAEVFSKNPSVAISTMPDMAAKFDIKIPESKEMKAEAVPIDTGPSLAVGNETTSKKLQKYFQEFVAQGMPPAQAATSARAQVQGEINANSKTYDEAKAAREFGQKLLDLSSTAKAGLSEAGTTGSFTNLKQAYDYLASALGDQEAEQRRSGRQLLGSIAPELVKMNRSPGAVSDFETKLYLGAGPNINQTPETNTILAQKMEDLGKLNLDYADFLEAFRQANSGSTAGAAKKWAEYRSAFPIFNQTKDKTTLNSDRPTWQEYFSGIAQPPPQSKSGELTQEVYNTLRAQGKTKDEIRALYGQ